MKNNSALQEAGKLLADLTGSCPYQERDWQNQGGCWPICKKGIESECWAMYAKHLAANETEKINGDI